VQVCACRSGSLDGEVE